MQRSSEAKKSDKNLAQVVCPFFSFLTQKEFTKKSDLANVLSLF